MSRGKADRRTRRAVVSARSAAARGVAGGAGSTVGTGAGRLRLPGLLPLYDAALTSADEFLECKQALDAERWVVTLWTTIERGAPVDAALDLALDDLLDEAARREARRVVWLCCARSRRRTC